MQLAHFRTFLHFNFCSSTYIPIYVLHAIYKKHKIPCGGITYKFLQLLFLWRQTDFHRMLSTGCTCKQHTMSQQEQNRGLQLTVEGWRDWPNTLSRRECFQKTVIQIYYSKYLLWLLSLTLSSLEFDNQGSFPNIVHERPKATSMCCDLRTLAPQLLN